MKIYVDADACPVKDAIISIATTANIPVILVTSYSHYSHKKQRDLVKTIYVDNEAEAADYHIMQLALAGDIIITQDYGLASIGLAKGCTVLHHKGFAYTDDNIDYLLQTRYLHAKARKAGERVKGPKAFTSSDLNKFKRLLHETIQQQA